MPTDKTKKPYRFRTVDVNGVPGVRRLSDYVVDYDDSGSSDPYESIDSARRPKRCRLSSLTPYVAPGDLVYAVVTQDEIWSARSGENEDGWRAWPELVVTAGCPRCGGTVGNEDDDVTAEVEAEFGAACLCPRRRPRRSW